MLRRLGTSQMLVEHPQIKCQRKLLVLCKSVLSEDRKTGRKNK